MKKLLLSSLALVSIIGIGSVAYGAISGSAHDFSAKSWVTDQQICLPCHAPHNGTVIPDAPLWNHDVTAATYTPYTSATFDATLFATGPAGVSKLCLSCHDGTVAVDAYTGHAGTITIGGSGNLGTDMSNDHPISFTYDTTLATTDGGLHDPSLTVAGVVAGTSGTIAQDMLFNDAMECASCHDVHNKYGINKLLVKSNVGSGLCLTCHDK